MERFIEFYGDGDQAIANLLGLWRMTINRRGALWGFQEMYARTYLRRLLNTRLSVVYVVETGHYLSGIEERERFAGLYRARINILKPLDFPS